MPNHAPPSGDRLLRALVDSSPSGLLLANEDGVIILVNQEIERLFGYTRDELLGQSVELLVPGGSRAGHVEDRATYLRHPETRPMDGGRELFGLHKDGSEVPVEIGLNPLKTADGLFVIASVVDISARRAEEAERRKLEDQLRQAQRVESIGAVAGGVAHDFNNMLAAMAGLAELALEDSSDRPSVCADLEQLLQCADRGKELVGRILKFTRRQDEARQPLSLQEVAEDTVRLLRATFPSTIDLQLRLTPRLPAVLGNATAIQQVILNLANNAAQAMPTGGRIVIALESLYLRDSEVREQPGLREGFHAVLTVDDEGPGMSPGVRDEAFEPFFTTKEPGVGTGLGLTLVRSIVADHGGAVELQSVPGRGTRARCFFPLLDEDPEAEASRSGSGARVGSARILFVDDEAVLVGVGVRRLRFLGYRMTGLSDAVKARELLLSSPEEFDLLVTDHTMPGLTGLRLAEEAHRVRPDLPVLLLSGYPPSASPEELRKRGVWRTLLKPVSLHDLEAAVADLLAESGADAEPEGEGTTGQP
jgi:PAS domain S-box-containing protein